MDERYPIGKFQFDGEMNNDVISKWISEIEDLPAQLRHAVKDLNEEQLNTSYRSGGWTVRQVVHHLGDSHMNAFIRFKLAITEEKPVVKPYDEELWAELTDYDLPIDSSLALIEGLHIRWTKLLNSLSLADMERIFMHPEIGEVSIGKNIALYAWHGRHHLAHITTLCSRRGW
nr:bacillithiol transferase BstA [Lysinibacillus timonensis]